MYSKLLLLLTTLVLAATLWTSCDDKQTCDCKYDPQISAIEIVALDTLRFYPNDSASTTVTIIVTDSRGIAMPGIKLDISLSNSSLGVLEYTDDMLRDTTNVLGRVNAIYRTYAQDGDQTITASAGGLTISKVLHLRQVEVIPTFLMLDITPTILEADSNEEVTFQIDVRLWDQFGHGIAGRRPMNYFPVGGIEFPPDTDSLGHSSFVWVVFNNFGTFWFKTEIDSLSDSARVEVRLREIQPPQYVVHLTWPHDTVTFLPGDSVSFPFVAHVANEQGQRVQGVRVEFTVQNPALGMINFTNPQLRDTTDAVGQVGLEFLSFAAPGDLVVSACVGDRCDTMTVALREIVYEPPQVSIHTIPATLRVDSNTVGEAFILVVARDNNGILLPGITPALTVEAGEFDPPPPTNSSGESQTSWRFFNQYGAFGVTATIEVNNQFATDSTIINVLYGP